jgi:hypothetical protein
MVWVRYWESQGISEAEQMQWHAKSTKHGLAPSRRLGFPMPQPHAELTRKRLRP